MKLFRLNHMRRLCTMNGFLIILKNCKLLKRVVNLHKGIMDKLQKAMKDAKYLNKCIDKELEKYHWKLRKNYRQVKLIRI